MFIRDEHKRLLQIDNYKIVKRLGSGGFGVVYKVVDIRDSTKVYALKLLHTVVNANRIQQQLEVLKILNSSELFLKIYLSKKIGSKLFFLLEYASELNLEKIVKAKILTEEEASKVLLDMLNILEFLQKHHIIHNDVKAENILKKDDRYYLIDYDVIKKGSPSKLLHIQGDDDYTAPEIYNGEHSYASDIYSLGCTLYYLLSGTHIYNFNKDTDFSQKMFAHLYQLPKRDENISLKMFNIIKMMTEKKVKNRATIQDIRGALHE